MLRSTILATVALAIGAAAVLGASQLRRGNPQSQPDFGTDPVPPDHRVQSRAF